MKKTLIVLALVVPALLTSAVPSSATIVFTAYADVDFGPAWCAPGLMELGGYHSGTVYSMAGGDYGREFRVDGDVGECGFFFALSSCYETGSAGIDNFADCYAFAEVWHEKCQSGLATYKAVTTVSVTDGGGESAFDETNCISC